MKLTPLAAGAVAAMLGAAALAAPAAAQTYMGPGTTYQTYPAPGTVYQRPSVPGQPGRVISGPMQNPDGAVVYHGYGNKPVRVTPSAMRSNIYGQPCQTVEKTDQKGLLRSYTYCR